jgi:hypothetical protein
MALSHAPSALARIYIGHPPFARLTWASVAQRLVGYAAFRTYIVLPAVIAAIWAARSRNPYILIGYAAFVPWGVLHLIAYSDIAGTLSGYYGYPFMIASFWPLVGVLLPGARTQPHKYDAAAAGPWIPVLAFAAMVAASFTAVGYQYNPGGLSFPKAFLAPPSLAQQTATGRAVAALVRSKPLLGVIVADTSVIALAPNDFPTDETVLWRNPARQPDAVAYFVRGYEADKVRRLAAASGLANHYEVAGTEIRIATRRPIAATAPISALLVPGRSSD